MKLQAIRSRLAIGVVSLAVISLATAGGVAMASTQGHGTGLAPAVTAPYVYAGSHDGAIFVGYAPTITTVGHLSLPAGSYMVTAKAQIQSQAGIGGSQVVCKLTMGSSTDQSQADAQDGNGPVSRQPVRNETLTLTLGGSIGSTTNLTMTCRNFGGGFTVVRNIKINALKVTGVTKKSF